MIDAFVSAWDARKDEVETAFRAEFPTNYKAMLLYLIPADTYQPSDYLYVKVYYGSCSGCDTLEDIRSNLDWADDDDGRVATETSIKDLMTLALHIIQGLKLLEED